MYAIATLVMGGNGYIPAAIALAKSLYPYVEGRDIELVCLVTDDVSRYTDLIEFYTHVYIVDKISTNDIPKLGISASKIYHWISDAPTKWNVLGLETYEKILFLDADMIVLSDIVSLFELPAPAAMFDHQTAREYVLSPRWTGDKERGDGFINWYKIALGLETTKEPIISGNTLPMTTGTKIPRNCLDNLRLHSNSQFAIHGGICLLKPSKKLLDEYKRQLPFIIDSLSRKTFSGGSPRYVKTETTLSSIDEITLALFLSDMGYTWTHIGMEYNVAAFHTYNIFRERTKILHFVGCYKPWGDKPNGTTEREYVTKRFQEINDEASQSHYNAVELWWEMYESPKSIRRT